MVIRLRRLEESGKGVHRRNPSLQHTHSRSPLPHSAPGGRGEARWRRPATETQAGLSIIDGGRHVMSQTQTPPLTLV